MNEVIAAPGPGFYHDPNDATVDRYWDGAQWTENRVPRGMGEPGKKEKEQKADGVIITGYILAVLMPLIGFIIGLTQINKNRHGIWVVVASVAAFVMWIAIFSSSGS
jgi:hypothetical protein